ncbi:MAG: hypothetical protein AMS21_00990 [Gemmatimonas sp. SG8_38_2]|nr:MAG: hypothetical protein AMS21_00990 [Gemmatimonas sp. SG8_38_2]
MTDRYYALTVVLDRDIREDDAQPIVEAIKTIRGVLDVQPHVAEFEIHATRHRLWYEMRKRVLDALDRGHITPEFATMD